MHSGAWLPRRPGRKGAALSVYRRAAAAQKKAVDRRCSFSKRTALEGLPPGRAVFILLGS